MKHKQIQIPHYLKDYIQSFWALDCNLVDVAPKSFRTIADGCPGLIFQHPAKGFFYQNNKRLPATFLYGQATKHNALQLSGQFSTIGIFFYPNALKTIFGLDASELTDSCIDLNFLSATKDSQFSENLLNCLSTAEQIKVISSFLFSQLQKNKQRMDNKADHALSSILLSKGSISLKKLTENLDLSERSLEPRLSSAFCQL